MNSKLTSLREQLNEAADRKDNDAIDRIFGKLSDDEISLLSGACSGNSGTCYCTGYTRSSPPNGTCGTCTHEAYHHKY